MDRGVRPIYRFDRTQSCGRYRNDSQQSLLEITPVVLLVGGVAVPAVGALDALHLDAMVDEMERIECGDCGNRHAADEEYDGSYL